MNEKELQDAINRANTRIKKLANDAGYLTAKEVTVILREELGLPYLIEDEVHGWVFIDDKTTEIRIVP